MVDDEKIDINRRASKRAAYCEAQRRVDCCCNYTIRGRNARVGARRELSLSLSEVSHTERERKRDESLRCTCTLEREKSGFRARFARYEIFDLFRRRAFAGR